MRDLAIFCSLTLLSSIVTAQPVCPEGTTFASYTDDFKSMNTDFWIPTQGMAEDSVVYDAEKGGATFKIREKMVCSIQQARSVLISLFGPALGDHKFHDNVCTQSTPAPVD